VDDGSRLPPARSGHGSPTTYDSRAQWRWRVAHPIATWSSGGKTPERLTVVSDADEDTIIERIEDAV
jgi:hypothetical protein